MKKQLKQITFCGVPVYISEKDYNNLHKALKEGKKQVKEQYGVFVYYKDEKTEPYCTYFNNKIDAIREAFELENNIKLNNEIEFDYIEVWQQDKDGYYGNTGEPILKLDL